MIIAYILRNANIKKSKNYSYSFLNTSPDPLLANFFLLQYNLRKSIIMGKAGEIHMYSFLVNPASRSGRGQKYWERIKSILEERLIPYQVYFSKGPGDMVNLSRRLTGALTPDGEDIHLVVLGGDGTANEVVQGIENFSKTRFSYIPTGSSNDLARDTGISRDPVEALECILTSAREQPMDVGFLHYNTAYSSDGGQPLEKPAEDRRFLVSSGIGFDAGVCQEAMHSKIKDFLNKAGMGKLTYLGIALKQLIRSGNAAAELTVEGNGDSSQKVSLSRLMFIACMSHCYEGGGFYFCPGRRCIGRNPGICVRSAAYPNGRCSWYCLQPSQENITATMVWSVIAAAPYESEPRFPCGCIPTVR